MLYWLPRTGASAARLYWESIRRVNEWISGSAVDTVGDRSSTGVRKSVNAALAGEPSSEEAV